MSSRFLLKQRTYNILDSIRIPFTCAPGAAFFYGFFDLAGAGLVPIRTLCVAAFIDAVIAALQGAPTRTVYINLAYVALIASFQWLKQALHNFADLKLVLELRRKFRMAICAKRTRLAYRHIEDPDIWDLIQRISTNPESGDLKRTYFHLIDLASFVIKVGGLLIILSSAVWWGALVVVGISALTLITGIRGGRAQYAAERKVSELDRKCDYFTGLLIGREAAPERDLFGFRKRIGAHWKSSFETSAETRIRTRIKWYISAYAGNAISLASWVFIMIVLLHPLKTGAISLGLFISLTQGFTNLDIVWGFMQTVHGIAKDGEYFKDLTSFASLDERKDAGDIYNSCREKKRPSEAPVLESIEFKEVWFRYPGTEPWILQNLSYTFEPARHYALVGENGAGKTTMTKLLTGLYELDRGDICINGRSTRDYTHEELMRFFSLVYQDFAKYQISLRDNILLGRNLQQASFGASSWERLLRVTGLDEVVERLPEGLDTHLGKLVSSGVDLSGGEWQRVAMARALPIDTPVRIFDEPTASLDPVAESDLYELFDSITRDRMTLFISHRLGSTKIADTILVLGNGHIIEHGSHDELMKTNGMYSKMFESQRSWYEV